jgi:hypothetical protein
MTNKKGKNLEFPPFEPFLCKKKTKMVIVTLITLCIILKGIHKKTPSKSDEN